MRGVASNLCNHTVMENHSEKRKEEKILMEEENENRDLGKDDMSVEEFIGEESDWSEDMSEYEKGKNRNH